MKTPQIPAPQLAKKIGLEVELWLKREDLHHYSSHKGRALPLMINEYAKRQGFKNFVISSSGNAALAAIIAVQTHNLGKPTDPLTLKIFVGQKIDPKKLHLLQKTITDSRITIEQIENPKSAAVQAGQVEGVKLLRQSTDELALRGYSELAKELSKIENVAAVFIPTSSGTTAEGLAAGFKQFSINPQIHIAQTTSCHPIADKVFELQNKSTSENFSTESSLAKAIVDNVALRKDTVANAVIESGGNAWIITNDEIKKAIGLVHTTLNITISPNSALSIAALIKAQMNNQTWAGPVVCLITGN